MLVLVAETHEVERLISDVPEIAYDLMELAVRPITIVYTSGASGVAPSLIGEGGSLGIRQTQEAFGGDRREAVEGQVRAAEEGGLPEPRNRPSTRPIAEGSSHKRYVSAERTPSSKSPSNSGPRRATSPRLGSSHS